MTIPLESVLAQQPELRLRSKDLSIIHRELVDVVFGGRESEATADLLLAWTTAGYSLHRVARVTWHLHRAPRQPPPPGIILPEVVAETCYTLCRTHWL